jgi:tetratricopeptide (TPR) repeat protein
MHALLLLLALVAAPLAQNGGPAVGQYVLLKRPGVAVVKDCRAQPPEVLDRPADVSFLVTDVQGDWLWIYTRLGMGWVHRGDVLLPDAAAAFFSAQLVTNPQGAEAWGRRGTALCDLGDFAGALPDLNEAHRLQPADARWLHWRAQCYTVLNELDKAEADAAAAARLDPQNSVIVAFQGTIAHRQGRNAAVAAFAEAAIKLDPRCADAYCLRGMVREDARDPQGALGDYSKAIELNAGHGQAYNNRAILAWNLSAYDRVIDDATACLRLGFPPAQAHRLRGLAWLDKNDPDKALADLDVCLRLQPDDTSARTGRARARTVKGDLAGAAEDLEKALALRGAPGDVPIFPVLADLYRKARNWPRAVATVQAWVARAPDDPRPHAGLAVLYATCPDGALRDGAKAVEHARRACELTQWKHPNALDTLAAACAEAGDFAAAVRWQKAALENESFAARSGDRARARLQLYEAGRPFHEN